MIESIKLIKLDLMITKNYLKELVFAGIILTIAILPNIPLALNIVLFIMGNTLLGYPFMIAEKDRLDKFYSIIAITKEEFIRGKYFMAIMYIMLMGLVLVPLNLMMYYVMKVEMNFFITIFLISIGILLYSIVAAIQIPCYFKWGYAKTKIITAILPFLIGLGVPIVVITGSKLIGEEKMLKLGKVSMTIASQNLGLICIGILVIIILGFSISYRISRKVYT